MRHRSQSQSISFRLSGPLLRKLGEMSEAHRVSAGELSRSIVIERLEGESDLRKVLDMIETLSQHHRKQTEALSQTIEELSNEVAALRHDFNEAISARS